MEDLDHARREAAMAIAELKVEDPSAIQDFSGWRLEVTDAAGAVVFSICLTEA